MARIIKIFVPLVSIVAIIAITGCEWSSGGDSSWSDTPAWVNFSGEYRGANNGVLVTDYSTSSQGSTTTETIGSGDGGSVYSGMSVDHTPIISGSVSVTAPGYYLNDDGSGTLIGNSSTGTVDYATGIISVDLGSGTLASNEEIDATYQYEGSGSSGVTIYVFNVNQQGNKLSITDNKGSVYEGKFGNVETSGGQTGGGTNQITGTVIGQYSAEGVSAAGVNVKMTGTFQADAPGMNNRTMLGTWIEEGGKTGDINGEAQ